MRDRKYANKYKDLKAKEKHIGNILKNECDLPIYEPDQPSFTQAKPKKVSQYIKSIRTVQSGISALKTDDNLITDTTDKDNILNNQFQSVFTTETYDPIQNKRTIPHPKIQKRMHCL